MYCNGIAVTEVHMYEDELREEPQAGAVTWRSRQHWSNGYAVDWHAEQITIAAHEVPREHAGEADRSRELGGGDRGPEPAELLNAALGSCVAHQFVRHAALRDVFLESLEVVCESHADLRGSYQVADVRPGLEGVRITIHVRADRTGDDTLDELLQQAVRTSPVAGSLSTAVPLEPSVHRATAEHTTSPQ